MQAIISYLRTAYSDQRLHELLAHAEDGKLSFLSCCCLMGAATADHPLRGKVKGRELDAALNEPHYLAALGNPFAVEAEREFMRLAPTDDAERCRIISPVIRTEIERRERKRAGVREEGAVGES